MPKIISVKGKEILDSRGNPTVYAKVELDDGSVGLSSVPSGASTGTREALELRDGILSDSKSLGINKERYSGKGVLKAVSHINNEIASIVIGIDAHDQKLLDQTMINFDGTDNKNFLGANAMLAVSLAVLRSIPFSKDIEVYNHIQKLYGKNKKLTLPVPMFNILNGGVHAAGSTDFQEFMIAPIGMENFSEALRAGTEIYHKLGKSLNEQGLSTNVGFEGGYAPLGLSNRQALGFITQAIEESGYLPGEEIYIALDPAATEFYHSHKINKNTGKYNMRREGRRLSSEEMINEYKILTNEFPIYSIEDGLSEDDWSGWKKLNKELGDKIQLVGDDLFVTNTKYLKRGIQEQSANAVLIKLNQIGTVTETLETIQMAEENNFKFIISHRSGETEDTTIADLSVGTSSGQIKTGAPARSERVAKYNRLLRIEETLGSDAVYAGKSIF
tara:strand:+ start:8285 stop:9619 length:1335 start_codon:yes stop_codon:yes gene_type:complete